MAYGRRFWRRYYRRYYRGRYSSIGKTKLSRNFKASAANMTQGGTFNVSAHTEKAITIPNNASESYNYLDLPSMISGSDMHRYLSNVFDQYRIEKLSIKIRLMGDNQATINNPAILFSCMDRTGFANNSTITTFRTYGSYKETQISGSKDISPIHWINIGQSNLVEFTSYNDTKKRASFPVIVYGCKFASSFANGLQVGVSIEVDAQIRYRGVRLDTSSVITTV